MENSDRKDTDTDAEGTQIGISSITKLSTTKIHPMPNLMEQKKPVVLAKLDFENRGSSYWNVFFVTSGLSGY